MADPESQMIPLAPPSIHGRSDEVLATIKPINLKFKREKSSKCIVYLLAGLVLQSTILLIFASVFWRVNDPKLRINSIEVQNLRYGNSSLPFLNMTMLAGVTVDNGANFGRFEFVNCKAVVLYGNLTIGDGDIDRGRVKARKTVAMNVTMEVRSVNLNSSSSSNTNTGMMELISHAKMSGKVHVMKIVNTKRTAELNCSMNLNLTSRSIMNLLCN